MKAVKSLITASVLLALGSVATAGAAEKEEDSAYQWGRWAVLSPAAGGVETFVAVRAPGADFNNRPGEATPFQPETNPVADDPRDRLPPRPPIPSVPDDPRDRLPPRPPVN